MRFPRGSTGRRRAAGFRRAAALLILLALGPIGRAGTQPAEPESVYRGRLLVDVLRELQSSGLEILFSTAVVPVDLRITVEPSATAPRRILEEILAPLGLEARDGPGGSILIVARDREPGPLGGQVRSASTGAPLAGASVRITGLTHGAITGTDGRYRIEGVPEGTHRVQVRALGYLPAEVSAVRVQAGAGARLDLALEDDPAFVTVVVTPGQHSLVRGEQTPVRTISQEEALRTPDIGGDISRVAELLPGIAAADNTAAFHARGSATRDVSYVLDGLELYDPFHLQSFQSPYTLIDSNAVDRADFLGGGFTADRGDRHGGFLEVSTLGPGNDAQGQMEIGTLNSRFAYRAPMRGSAGSWLVSVRGWYPETFVDSIEVGRGEQDLEPRFGDLYAKAAFAISPRLLLSAHGMLVYDRLKFQERDEEVNESVDAVTKNSYLWLRLMHAGPGDWSSETVLSGGRIDRVRDGVSAPDEAVVVDDRRKVDFVGIEHDAVWQAAAAHALKAGVDVRWLDARYRYTADVTADPAGSAALQLDPDGTSLALYGAYVAQAGSRLTTELGLRWDRQGYTGDTQVDPRFNLVWRPGERTEVRFAMGRFSQSQRIHELQVEDAETAFHPAERSDQVELSYQHAFGEGPRLRVDAYYRRLQELRPRYENLFEPIELFPETTDDRVMIAPPEARLRGIELLLRSNPARPLFWSASYTYSRAEDEIDGASVPRSWDQPHAGKVLFGYERKDRWSVSVAGTAHTGWPTTPVTAEEVPLPGGGTEYEAVPGARNSVRFPGYLRLDLQGRWGFAVPGGRLWLTLTVLNFTDRRNVCCVQEFLFDPQQDGSVSVEPVYDYWLGITPSFSVLWAF